LADFRKDIAYLLENYMETVGDQMAGRQEKEEAFKECCGSIREILPHVTPDSAVADFREELAGYRYQGPYFKACDDTKRRVDRLLNECLDEILNA
jgi:hypothetical protein